VIHSCFGSKVNLTIAKAISEHLSNTLGISIKTFTDPYRIFIYSKYPISAEVVIQSLKDLAQGSLENIIKTSISKSRAFKRRLIEVAKRFGVISRKASISEIGLEQLVEALVDTPVFKEAAQEVLRKDLDVKTTANLLGEIRSGRVKVESIELETPSIISSLGLNKYYSKTELVTPSRAREFLIEIVKARGEHEKITLFCLSCYKWFKEVIARDVTKNMLKCPICGSSSISASKLSVKQVKKLIKKRDPSFIAESLQVAKVINDKGVTAVFFVAAGVKP